MNNQENIFKKVFDKAPVGIVITDSEGKVVTANQTVSDMFGYSVEEIKNRDNVSVYTDRSDRKKIFETLREEGAVSDFEVPVKDREGNILWLNLNIRTIEAGSAKYNLMVFIDITRRKDTEKKLRDSLENTRLILEAIPDMVFRIDKDGVFLDYKAHRRDLYRDPEEFLGKRYDEVLPPEISEKISENIRKALKSSAVQQFEYQLDVGGKKRFWQSRLIGDSESMNVIGIVHDITEMREAFEEKLKLELRMQQTQKLESMGLMAGGIAHDFNNILMAIIGNAEMAAMNVDPSSPARTNIEEILEASARAGELTSQMLAYSGRGKFKLVSFDLNSLINEMKNLIDSATSKRITLDYELAEDPPVIRGDPTQIKQVVLNIAINASEAVGENEGRIRISTGRMACDESCFSECAKKGFASMAEPPEEGYCSYFEVEDDGCGMDDETASRIFEPFFTTKFTGRGLGMAAVEGIVRGHRGAISIDTAPGKGTVFRVLFPYFSGDEDRGPADDPPLGRPGKDPKIDGKILVVDDEEPVNRLARKLLESSGVNTISARDGSEALNIFEERGNEIACVILDLTMPGIDGVAAFQRLRAISPEIPVIITSGYNEKDVWQRFGEERPSGFLKKPYKLEALIDKLREIL